MDFSAALLQLRDGKRVARTDWDSKDMWVGLHRPLDEHGNVALPYLFLSYSDDKKRTPVARAPWLPSQTDLLAEDWILVLPDPGPEVTLVYEVASLMERQLKENTVWTGVDCKPFARKILLKVADWLEQRRCGDSLWIAVATLRGGRGVDAP